jgi:hypothetical protein
MRWILPPQMRDSVNGLVRETRRSIGKNANNAPMVKCLLCVSGNATYIITLFQYVWGQSKKEATCRLKRPKKYLSALTWDTNDKGLQRTRDATTTSELKSSTHTSGRDASTHQRKKAQHQKNFLGGHKIRPQDLLSKVAKSVSWRNYRCLSPSEQ